jgi:hypothetical protein
MNGLGVNSLGFFNLRLTWWVSLVFIEFIASHDRLEIG